MAASEPTPHAGLIDVRAFGAMGDGTTRDHPAIQRAIDFAAERGGGTVVVPAGQYLCGTIELRSHVRLHLTAGAVIQASGDPADYRRLLEPEAVLAGSENADAYRAILAGDGLFRQRGWPFNFDQSLLVAQRCTNVSIVGPGRIEGGTEHFMRWEDTADGQRRLVGVQDWRPGPVVAFWECQEVVVHEVDIRHNPFFAVYLHGCRHARLSALRIVTGPSRNGDGIHVVSSDGVVICGCQIDSEDDAICFYTNWTGLWPVEPQCRNITVSDCVLSSACSGIRIGYGADGRLGDMVFNNLVIKQAMLGIDFICTGENLHTPVVIHHGPAIERMVFSNILIDGARKGLTATICRGATPPAGIRDLLFSNLRVRSTQGSCLLGRPDLPLRDLVFDNVDFAVTGDLPADAADLPDTLGIYGSAAGWVPHALTLRDAAGVSFRNARIRWDGATGDWQSGLCARRVSELDTAGLRVEPLREGWDTQVVG